MNAEHGGRSKFDLRLLFRKSDHSVRAKETRLVVLTLLLGLMFCAIFAGALLLLNKQGRI